MRRKSLTTLLFLSWITALLPADTPEITALKHNPETGITQIAWRGISADAKVMLYRSAVPLNAETEFFADKFKFSPGVQTADIVADGNGCRYYKLTGIDASGRPLTAMSEEKMIEECDRTPPAAVDFNIVCQDGIAMLRWKQLPRNNPDKVVKFLILGADSPSAALTVCGDAAKGSDQFPLPASCRERFLAVAAVDAAGNRSPVGKRIFFGNRPDFRIATTPTPQSNPDIRMERMYPITGRNNRVEFTIHNDGGNAGTAEVNIGIFEAGGSLRPLISRQLAGMEPGSRNVIAVDYQPQHVGKSVFHVEIHCPDDADQSNNRLELEVYQSDRELYFLWYGEVSGLSYANYGEVHCGNLEDWRRRGGRALTVVGRGGTVDGYYRKITACGAAGMQLDELGGTHRTEEFLPELHRFKQAHPECFFALWHIGGQPDPLILAAQRKGEIDIVILELYLANIPEKRRERLENLAEKIKWVVAHGVPERTVIGLGARFDYAGWHGAEEHVAWLEEQIKLIRELAPMMPGVAFYSTDTLPGVKEKVDLLCRKYFLENQSSISQKE